MATPAKPDVASAAPVTARRTGLRNRKPVEVLEGAVEETARKRKLPLKRKQEVFEERVTNETFIVIVATYNYR